MEKFRVGLCSPSKLGSVGWDVFGLHCASSCCSLQLEAFRLSLNQFAT